MPFSKCFPSNHSWCTNKSFAKVPLALQKFCPPLSSFPQAIFHCTIPPFFGPRFEVKYFPSFLPCTHRESFTVLPHSKFAALSYNFTLEVSEMPFHLCLSALVFFSCSPFFHFSALFTVACFAANPSVNSFFLPTRLSTVRVCMSDNNKNNKRCSLALCSHDDAVSGLFMKMWNKDVKNKILFILKVYR